MNGSDCGMFTCKYAEYITKDRPITFTQVSISCVVFFKVLVGHTCTRIFNFNFAFISQTETHALFQKTNGMGDYEAEIVVIGLFFCIEHILTCCMDMRASVHFRNPETNVVCPQSPVISMLSK